MLHVFIQLSYAAPNMPVQIMRTLHAGCTSISLPQCEVDVIDCGASI